MCAQQKQVVIKMSSDFLNEIDSALSKLGYSDRSSLIRDSVYKELRAHGIHLPASIKVAPSRKGKGGSPTHRKNKIALVAEDQANYDAKKKRI